MANTTISDLPNKATTLFGTEYLVLDQEGETKKLLLSDLFVQSGSETETSVSLSNGVLTYKDEKSESTLLTLIPDGTIGYDKLSTGGPTWNSFGVLRANSFRAAQGEPNATDISTRGYAFGDDGDTGMFQLGLGGHGQGGPIGFFSNNVERMRIEYDGRVGMGTSTPDARLHVADPQNSAVNLMLTSTKPSLVFEHIGATTDDDNSFQLQSNDGIFSIRTGVYGNDAQLNIQLLGIDLDGNVYIHGGDLYVNGDITSHGTDFHLYNAGRSGGNVHSGRALVHDNEDILSINYNNDFTGGTDIGGSVRLMDQTVATLKASIDETLVATKGYVDTVLSDGSLDGGIKISGHLSPSLSAAGAGKNVYATDATNLWLKGNSAGVSGIFFESDEDDFNINRTSDGAFIQYRAHGIGNTTGEQSDLVIGITNDSFEQGFADKIVFNTPGKDQLVITYDAGVTEHKIWHAGNDGVDSGLDADLLDGQEGSYYASVDYVDAAPMAYVAEYAMKYSGATGTFSTTANTFVDLDLSSIVGSNRALVILEVYDCSRANSIFYRTKGSTLVPFVGGTYSGWGAASGTLGTSDNGGTVIVTTDENGIMQHRADSTSTGVNYTVQAYQKLA
jgi:hypothetical protein